MATNLPAWLQHARDHWEHRGDKRPSFAIEPEPGQESVWDYPRPPAVVADRRLVEVRYGDTLIATTHDAIRVLETSHPPSFYLPADSVADGALEVAEGSSHCEWKGQAQYLCVAGQPAVVGWRYPKPYPEFASFAGYVSFYPHTIDCWVDGEAVRAQESTFYGGWVTDEIVGPFKGAAGTSSW